MLWFFVFCVFMFLLLSFIDIDTFNKKDGNIPSFLTDAFLIIAFVVGVESYGGVSVVVGVFGFLLGMLFSDMDIWGGWADFKVFVAGCLFFSSLSLVCWFGVGVVVFGLIFKGFVKFGHFKRVKEVPFIPVVCVGFIVTACLWFLEVLL